MDKYGYSGEERFRPLSPWAYFGYGLLFAIPIVGLVLLIVFSLSEQNGAAGIMPDPSSAPLCCA